MFFLVALISFYERIQELESAWEADIAKDFLLRGSQMPIPKSKRQAGDTMRGHLKPFGSKVECVSPFFPSPFDERNVWGKGRGRSPLYTLVITLGALPSQDTEDNELSWWPGVSVLPSYSSERPTCGCNGSPVNECHGVLAPSNLIRCIVGVYLLFKCWSNGSFVLWHAALTWVHVKKIWPCHCHVSLATLLSSYSVGSSGFLLSQGFVPPVMPQLWPFASTCDQWSLTPLSLGY